MIASAFPEIFGILVVTVQRQVGDFFEVLRIQFHVRWTGSLQRKCGCSSHEVWATLEGSHCHLREAHSMPVSMYTVSIPIFIQHLNGLNAVLDKAAAWATARKVNEADLLNMRLSPDMFNLARQVRAATDHAANAAGRLAGKDLLKFANDETTIAQLKDRIAKTIDYLKSVKQSEIDGTEDKDISITFPSGQTRQFTGQSLLLGNSLPNFWFHTTTAYDIVRQCGVEVGKRDFMGTPPAS
jgi:uncharacterized protein